MANWSDPRPNAASFAATDARTETYDAGLRAYMLSVYNYMTSGILLTGVIAMLFASTGYAETVFMNPGILKYIIVLAPLGFVFAMRFGQGRMSFPTLQAMFWGFAITMGLSLSTIFLQYTGTSIAGAFFATASGFAALSLYGYTTRRDLSAFGTFLIMGLIGLIVATIVSMFLAPEAQRTATLVISAIGVLLFAGLTAYDTQRIKSIYAHVAGTADEGRTVVMSALSLYLDFINMFLFILRLFGSSRN